MKPIRSLVALAALCAASPAFAESTVQWTGWDPALFERARAEKRLVILDLEAVWCHWCHVMAEKTYSNAAVERLIGDKFIAVRVDQDANPDLSSRYGDWGWPATIIFAPDGAEIVKRRGYIEPERMAALLKAVIADPTPGPSVNEEAAVAPASTPFLPEAQRRAMLDDFNEGYDAIHGGWGDGQHFIDADTLDLEMTLAETGDAAAKKQARKTLDAAVALIDPVWGGVYQYSATPDWATPHYEKIMSMQANDLRIYAQAYAHWRDPIYLKAATAILSYLTNFLLAPEGGFYVSQDADLSAEVDGAKYYALDDRARRKTGMPRIDTHVYARENGWAISGLAAFYAISGDPEVLAKAERAAHWVLANRALPGGGFRHDGQNSGKKDRGGPFLGDTLAMGQAFLALYAATGDRDWLRRAQDAGVFIGAHFANPAGGFLPSESAEASVGAFKHAAEQIDDQTQVARFMHLLNRYTGVSAFADLAVHAMRYAVGAAGASPHPLPGLLLADFELAREPTHITIVGHKDDPDAQKLHAAALAFPAVSLRLDWWDTREGPLANPDVTFPEMDRAAAFACSNRTCSLPVYSAAELTATVARMNARGSVRKSEN